jgi:hypothetical protein
LEVLVIIFALLSSYPLYFLVFAQYYQEDDDESNLQLFLSFFTISWG